MYSHEYFCYEVLFPLPFGERVRVRGDQVECNKSKRHTHPSCVCISNSKKVIRQDFMNNPAFGGKIRKIDTYKTGETNGKQLLCN